MQPELAVDGSELRGLDQPRMGDHDGMQHTVELAGPKIQEFSQFGKMRMQIVPLPEKALQKTGKIRPVVKYVRGGQSETFALASKVR